MNARELFNKAKELMTPEEIDSQHELGSDLYLKVTPTSQVGKIHQSCAIGYTGYINRRKGNNNV